MNGITCQDCAGSGCKTCNNTGYVKSYITNFGDTVTVCEYCQGIGCDLCHGSGARIIWHKVPGQRSKDDNRPLVPMPYGKILPDLTDCDYPNEGMSEPDDDDYDEFWDTKFLCPGCGSDNVVGLSEEHNPECSVMGENLTPGGRWFCISCQDSWCYERER